MRITMSLEPKGLSRSDDGWEHNAYDVTLTRDDGMTLTVQFKTGTGWTRDPSIGDVLESLCLDLSASDPEEAEELGLTIPQWEALKAHNIGASLFFGDALDDIDPGAFEAMTGTEVTL